MFLLVGCNNALEVDNASIPESKNQVTNKTNGSEGEKDLMQNNDQNVQRNNSNHSAELVNQNDRQQHTFQLPWDVSALKQVPVVYEAEDFTDDSGVHAIFYESVPYQGNPTRVFAYYGLPEVPEGESVPGVVLVHGGGGTAFKQWVQKWNESGYAAIAMDLEGHVPVKNEENQWSEHEWSGPQRQGIYGDINLTVEDQWMYHAVANVMLAHSFLASLEEVDAQRIGVTGISWGGIITNTVVGVDDRLKFAIPVYGTGYLYEAGNQYTQAFENWDTDTQQTYLQMWDPSVYLRMTDVPVLWVSSDQDSHFPLSILTMSYEEVKDHSSISIHPGMKHGHGAGWAPNEIYLFADSIVKPSSFSFPSIMNAYENQGQVYLEVQSDKSIDTVKVMYTENYDDPFQAEWSEQVYVMTDDSASIIVPGAPRGSCLLCQCNR